MSPKSLETDNFSDELIADFIETGNFHGPKGLSWAIEYITKKDLSELRTKSEKNALSTDLQRVTAAERFILEGFSAFLSSRGVKIILTEYEKTKNIRPFIPDIAMLFRLRNRRNPEELRKLEILQSLTDTSEYSLVLHFWVRKDTSEFFIQSIRIEKTHSEGSLKKPEDASKYESPEMFA